MTKTFFKKLIAIYTIICTIFVVLVYYDTYDDYRHYTQTTAEELGYDMASYHYNNGSDSHVPTGYYIELNKKLANGAMTIEYYTKDEKMAKRGYEKLQQSKNKRKKATYGMISYVILASCALLLLEWDNEVKKSKAKTCRQ